MYHKDTFIYLSIYFRRCFDLATCSQSEPGYGLPLPDKSAETFIGFSSFNFMADPAWARRLRLEG